MLHVMTSLPLFGLHLLRLFSDCLSKCVHNSQQHSLCMRRMHLTITYRFLCGMVLFHSENMALMLWLILEKSADGHERSSSFHVD